MVEIVAGLWFGGCPQEVKRVGERLKRIVVF